MFYCITNTFTHCESSKVLEGRDRTADHLSLFLFIIVPEGICRVISKLEVSKGLHVNHKWDTSITFTYLRLTL